MASNQDWMKMTKGGKRDSEYSDSPKKKTKRKNPTRDLSAGTAMTNVLKIAKRAY